MLARPSSERSRIATRRDTADAWELRELSPSIARVFLEESRDRGAWAVVGYTTAIAWQL
jgi:hypothetical protein